MGSVVTSGALSTRDKALSRGRSGDVPWTSTPSEWANLPDQPPEAEWPFERELQEPVHAAVPFGAGRPLGPRELDFRHGVSLDFRYPDPGHVLQTARADFTDFLKSIKLGDSGSCPIVIGPAKTAIVEEYRIAVGKNGIVLSAGDTEGIRRGLVHLEDMILARDRHCLPFGTVKRKPVIRTRLSRCFYGPINRPPKCRDELMDEVNYYPDGYLNRLVHHGINALWLTVKFRDLCASTLIPELGAGSARRLEKLRRTVRQCSRYGIRIYVFCIEPSALPVESPVFKAHPEVKGGDILGERSAFCTSSAIGQAYLEEATRTLFSEVPGLGGLLCIPVGERFTHCYSGGLTTNCPRCGGREPHAVLADTLSAMERGMRSVAPNAGMIAWPYGQLICWGTKETVVAAAHMPGHVALQHNFETGGKVRQLGKWRPLWDYWLSWTGPSEAFAACARAARKNHTRMFAKLQTSCSHEVATTQYVPAPGLIYRKYRKMHALGVSGVTQGWYFGNYPSVMTKASQVLSFAPLPKTEKEFLLSLARRDWGCCAPQMARAWQHFQHGYSQYPGAQVFGYYGPMHDGVVWPLHLKPRHLPLSPTWRIVHPPSGDQVGECISPDFRYDEVLALCKAMRDGWRRGVAVIRRLERHQGLSKACRREIGVAKALGIQFDSGYNILRFYSLRDKLATAGSARRQAALLARLRNVVAEEIANSTLLLQLSRANRTLGFHSEAEGYKYFPAKLKWRINQLRTLLETEFPAVRSEVGTCPLTSFQDYVGKGPAIQAYTCRPIQGGRPLAADPFASLWDDIERVPSRFWAAPRLSEAERPFPFNTTLHPLPPGKAPLDGTSWRATFDSTALYYCLEWGATVEGRNRFDEAEEAEIRLTFEPVRLGPGISFAIRKSQLASAAGGAAGLECHTGTRGNASRVTIVVPFQRLGLDLGGRRTPAAMRMNVSCFFSPIIDVLCFSGRALLNSWAPTHTTMPRNLFGYSHPANYGWMRFERTSGSGGRRPSRRL